MKLTKQQWLDQYKNTVSQRDYELLSLAYDILDQNTLRDYKQTYGKYTVISPWDNDARGIWNWDSGFHAVGVSRFNTDLAKDCIEGFTQFQLENGMFPDAISANGKKVEVLSKPPVLPWAAVITYRRCGDKEFLRRTYNQFVKNEAFLIKERCLNGLFYYSAQQDVEKDNYLYARWESGWDNSPRWDKPAVNLWAIDFNCFMVMKYRALAEMAQELGEPTETVNKWKQKAETLSQLIETKMFNEQEGYYADVNKLTGKTSRVLTPASFMPLYIGIASKEHAEKMAELAADKNKFYPGMPTVAYDDPTYSRDYWRGPTWLNVAYFAVKGLINYGFCDTADGIREYILNMVYKNRDTGIWENYDSKAQEGLHWHEFSWSCVFVIEFILNKFSDQNSLLNY